MSQTNSILVELGTEELPPKALKTLSEAFSKNFADSLSNAGLLSAESEIKSFATPRRLAVWIDKVADAQADFSQTQKGPAVIAAFNDQGNPTQAALGFARSCQVKVEDLGREKTDKGEWLAYNNIIKGQSIGECAQEALDNSIAQLPIPKRMRWGNKDAEFVRPAHWLLALYGNQILELETIEQLASNLSYGHRFHHPQSFIVSHADDYAVMLEKAFVVANFRARKHRIQNGCEMLANQINGKAVLNADLLDEVTALTEWPVPIVGEFDPAFLDIPREALVASMADHQKYFHLIDKNNQLLPNFITVSNIQSTAPEKVLLGNERVLNARLSDAQFFWEQDKQHPLETSAKRLEQLLFHIKLGSVADRTQRLTLASGQIAKLIHADVSNTERAARLCKLDLVSNMVGEFASLQGTMGRYYALHGGENTIVANAIEQHYWPKFAGDKLPESDVSAALALADRLDSLIGIFATGERPSGVKDPYALRRAALSVIRILIEKKIDISLQTLLGITANTFVDTDGAKVKPEQSTQNDILQFIYDRLRAYYTGQGFDVNAFHSIAAVNPERIYDFDQRIRAVREFFESDNASAIALAAANKRIANILKKNTFPLRNYEPTLFNQDEERQLCAALEAIRARTLKLFAQGLYSDGLKELASLRKPVDAFFEEVRVIVDEQQIRHNRLNLLDALRTLFLQVSDISYMNIDS